MGIFLCWLQFFLQISPPKSAKKAEAKIDTKTVSYQLFKSGKSITEIALERNITNSTVETHLTHFISTGEIDLEEILSEEKISTIKKAIAIHGNTSAKALKENLPEEIGYGEIRMVMGAPSIPQGGS